MLCGRPVIADLGVNLIYKHANKIDLYIDLAELILALYFNELTLMLLRL